jgi:hypothetical protein
MYTLKGFMLMQPLVNNDTNQISPLGEMSNITKTFSKDIGQYSVPTYPNLDLLTYVSRQVDLETDVVTQIKLNNDRRDIILTLGDWLYTECITGNFSTDRISFSQGFLAEFSSIVKDFDSGEMINSGGNNWLPEWISFSTLNQTDDSIKIWFSNDSFISQYDEYEILVVPPVDDIDALFSSAASVKALIDQYSLSARQDRINLARNPYPDTQTRVVEYNWNITSGSGIITLSLPWSVVIYGPAGDNVDSIKAAIIEYTLSNSQYGQEVWEEYIPDLFKSTEYLIVPMWENYSIPNETLRTGLNSPILNANKFQAHIGYIANEINFYPTDHIYSNVEYTVANYKSMGFFIIGSNSNRDGIFSFKERFSDYIVISSLSPDFSRISPVTQGLIFTIGRLLNVADIVTEFSDIPLGLSKLIRNDKLYLTATYNDVLYVVLTRSSYNVPEIDSGLIINEPM